MTLLEHYLKSKKVQKTLSTKRGEEGFSLVELVVVIAVLAILSAVAIPAFNGVQVRARASAVKNGLVNGIKECVILEADFQDTEPQNVVQSFPGNFLDTKFLNGKEEVEMVHALTHLQMHNFLANLTSGLKCLLVVLSQKDVLMQQWLDAIYLAKFDDDEPINPTW